MPGEKQTPPVSTFLMPLSRSLAGISIASSMLLTSLSLPAIAAQQSQQERAEAAMERSIAAQQAGLEAVRDKGEPDSVRQQRESILRQTNAIQGTEAPAQPASAEQTASRAASSQPEKTFFSTPWPSSIPLAVPNVQMVDDECQPLEKNEVDKLVQAASKKQGIEPELLKSVMRQESAFKPCAVSTAGAMGLMQIMPETAGMLGLEDPFDPAKNIEAGAQFLKMMLNRYQGDVPMALGAYNAGPGKVDKAGGVPPIAETLQYVTNILRSLSLAY